MPAFTAAIAIAGAALAGVGAYQQYQGAKSSAEYQKDMTAKELQAEAVRQRAMELDARRKQMEIVRNQNKARAMALATANNQGGQLGSGLQGGYGGISGQSLTNLQGINQNLEFGQQLFGINSAISQDKINMAGANTQMALGSGLSSLGGTMINSASTIGNLTKMPTTSASATNPVNYWQTLQMMNSRGIY